MEHTPGPWTVERLSGWGDYCVLEAHNEEIPAEQDDANARLIAAAPDLLTACELLVERCNSTWGKRNAGMAWTMTAEAREAIAKAKVD